jgi:hypothetical protein
MGTEKMKRSRDNLKEQVVPEGLHTNSSGNIPQVALPGNVDPHNRHPSMSWEEFICYRFMQVL